MVSYKFSMFLPQNETKTHHIIFTQRKCVRKNAGRVCGNRRWTNPNTANWMNLRFAVKRISAWCMTYYRRHATRPVCWEIFSLEKALNWYFAGKNRQRENCWIGWHWEWAVCLLFGLLLTNEWHSLLHTKWMRKKERERERAFHWQNGKMESVQFAAY